MHSIESAEGKPKLYITQPSLSTPTRSMQAYYHSGNEEQAVKKKEEERQVEEADSKLMKKAFNEMTIEEKVNYFCSLPFHAPKVKCQVVTEEKTLIGIIEGYKESMVKIKLGSKPEPVSVAIDQIEEINLIGF